MSRRERLLTLGEYFNDTDKLKQAVGKDVLMDMAILYYALETNKVHILKDILNIEELAYDIRHTERHFELLEERKRLKEE